MWPLLKQHLVTQMGLNEVFPSSHAEGQMKERHIILSDIHEIVRFWNIDEMYDRLKYPYGKETAFTNKDPVFSITGQDARGRKLTIAFALKKNGRALWFKIVTAFFEHELRKNRHQANLDHNSF